MIYEQVNILVEEGRKIIPQGVNPIIVYNSIDEMNSNF